MSDDDPYVVLTDYGEATVEPPPWLAKIPPLGPELAPGIPRGKKRRGLPGLAQSWPGATAVDQRRARFLAESRHCSLCGCAIAPGPIYNMHVSRLCGSTSKDGTYTTGTPGPQHRSCAIYSAIKCPYLRYEESRGRFGGTTRQMAAVVGFQRYETFSDGTIFDMRLGQLVPMVMFRHLQPVEVIRYGRGDELLSIYPQAVEADARRIDMARQLYWTDSPSDRVELDRYARAVAQRDGLEVLGRGHTSVGGIDMRHKFGPCTYSIGEPQ